MVIGRISMRWTLTASLLAAIIAVSQFSQILFFDDNKQAGTQCSTMNVCLENVKPSQVHCKSADGLMAQYPFAQSCLYTNIYFVKGRPTLFTTVNETLPLNFESMKYRDDYVERFRPRHVRLESMTALCHKYCVDFYNDTSVLREFWLGNIGHSLFDQLYSSFIGLIEYSNDRHLKPFRAINVKRSDAESVPFVHSIINTSIPMGLVNSEDFFRPDRVQHLREVLVPNHARCISSPANDGWNYRMDKGYELDGFRHFRAHLYARFAVPPPPSWAQGVGRASLRAIVVLNKRYSPADLQELLAALGDAAPGINGSVVDWRPLSFRDQLLILSRSHIHLSAPGTGMMYQPFLPDGAVHVNLGSCTPFP